MYSRQSNMEERTMLISNGSLQDLILGIEFGAGHLETRIRRFKTHTNAVYALRDGSSGVELRPQFVAADLERRITGFENDAQASRDALNGASDIDPDARIP